MNPHSRIERRSPTLYRDNRPDPLHEEDEGCILLNIGILPLRAVVLS